MAKRATIPQAIRQDVLYCSALACAICQDRGRNIHHIDKNNSNNDPDNLALLCQTHHDDAHTQRELSLNLTPDRIRDLRDRWYQKVRKHRTKIASRTGQMELSHGLSSDSVTWGYINHSRLIQSVSQDFLHKTDPKMFKRLKRSRIMDDRGVLIQPMDVTASDSYVHSTIYDWFNHADSMALHVFLSQVVDRFSEAVQPIHLDEYNWNRTFIKQMLSPGKFIFINRGQYFKTVRKSAENAEVFVRAFKRNVEAQYCVNTRNMYGVSSICVSFTGHNSCASLLQLKSIEDQEKARVLHCTPIALGISFHSRMRDFVERN